ncbi:MAG TPA: hypothetical protein VI300_31205, partial [Solirubrobacter sp.]
CHGTSVDGEGLQAQFDAALGDLLAQLTAAVKAPFASKLAYKGSVKSVVIDPANVASVALVTGRLVGLNVTFTAAIDDPNGTGTVTSLSTGPNSSNLGNFVTVDGTGTPTSTKVFDVLGGRVAKANWNYSLLDQDGSKSIHNPTFVFTVLGNTKAALVSGSGAL